MTKLRLAGRASHWSVFTGLGWALAGIGLVSMLILDHRSGRNGGPAYIFKPARPARTEKAAPPAAAEPSETWPEPERKATRKSEPRADVPDKPVRTAPPATRPEPGKVALVVDDMGNSLQVLDDLLRLGEPVSVSVLPYGEFAEETARIAHEKGLEVLLHLPLESLNNHESESTTRGLILAGMDPASVRTILEDDLGRVPHIRGVNNHMGSKVTADAPLMRLILEPIKKRGLYFLDSRTSGRSVAYDVARGMGIPTAYRQVFLDADGDGRLIKERLLELFRLARREGRAVGICHPFAETIQTLKDNFHLLESYDLKAVFASELASR